MKEHNYFAETLISKLLSRQFKIIWWNYFKIRDFKYRLFGKFLQKWKRRQNTNGKRREREKRARTVKEDRKRECKQACVRTKNKRGREWHCRCLECWGFRDLLIAINSIKNPKFNFFTKLYGVRKNVIEKKILFLKNCTNFILNIFWSEYTIVFHTNIKNAIK